MDDYYSVLAVDRAKQTTTVADAEGLPVTIPWDVVVAVVAPTLIEIIGDLLKGFAARVKRWAGRGKG